jgi:hypothetical protein
MAANLGLIDISTRRLRVLVAEPTDKRGEPRLMRREVLLEHGLESLPEALDALVEDEVLLPGRWQLALSGDLVVFQRLSSPLKDLRKVRMTLDFELETALPFRREEVVVAPLLRRVDEGTDILVFCTRRAVLEQLLEQLHERRIEAVSVVPSAFGAVPVEAVSSGRHLVLDLGRDQIDVVAIEDGAIEGFSVLPGGGDLVTMDLRRSHLLDSAEAEFAKVHEGGTEEGRAALAPVVEDFARHVQRALRGGLRSVGWRDATVHLAGGAAGLTGLIDHLETHSEMRFFRVGEVDSLTPDAEQACALAAEVGHLRAQVAGGGFAPVNLRAGDLAHTTDVMKVLKGFRPVAGWAAAILILMFLQFFAGVSAKDARASRFESARRGACATIAGIENGNALQCLAAMRETIAGTGSGDIPRFDAIDLLSRISQAVPSDLDVKLDEIRIDGRSLRLVGTTTGFQQARRLVDALMVVRCITDLRSDKTVKKGDRVVFSLSGRIDCSAEPKLATAATAAPRRSPAKVKASAVPAKLPGTDSSSAVDDPASFPSPKAKSDRFSGQSKAQAEQERRMRNSGDPAKVIEGPGESVSKDEDDEDGSTDSTDSTDSTGSTGATGPRFVEPMIDPSTGNSLPTVIPDPYPGIAPFPGGSLKLPSGIGNVMKLPTADLLPPPDEDEEGEEE